MLALVSIVVFASPGTLDPIIWILLLALAGVPAWLPSRSVASRLGRLAEVSVIALGTSDLAASNDVLAATALLPYLIVPVVIPALEGRLSESFTLLGVGAVFLTVAGL